MRFTRKKSLALLLSLAMIITGLPAFSANRVKADEFSIKNDLLAAYNFSGDTANDEDIIKDISGNNKDAVIHGDGAVREDGVLTLPGGSYGSKAAYVSMPKGMFDNQNEITISSWIKSSTSAGNYSAIFFGTTETLPVGYWLLNPTNPGGTLKSVFTDSVDKSAPYNTEKGISPSVDSQGILGPETTGYKGVWVNYTTVISEKSITTYMNGSKVGTVSLTRKVSDFGSDLVAYLGKSSYQDAFFSGGFKNLYIYDRCLSDTEVSKLFTEQLSDEDAVNMAAVGYTLLGVEDGLVEKNLNLASTTLNDLVKMEWRSSNPDVIGNDGVINQQVKSKTKVTLTATFARNTAKKEKSFEVYVLPSGMTEYSLTVDGDKTGIDMSKNLYGLFFEDINNSADGGLNPQMVKNYSFENYRYDSGKKVNDFKNQWTSSKSDQFEVLDENGLNSKNKHYARLTGNQTLTNCGFTPISKTTKPSMAVEKNVAIDVSLFAKAAKDYKGKIKIVVKNQSGDAITNEVVIEPDTSGKWKKLTGKLTGKVKELGKLELIIEGAEDDSQLDVDMISLSPENTYGYGNKNYGYGAGLRKDLVEKLKGVNPKFVRFPGGCIIEGAYEWDSYYNWRNSVGPLEERKAVSNLWGNDNSYGYMQSYGLGYHEILTLCEDMGAEPYPILNAGILCQARSNNLPAASGEDLDVFVKDATDLLDYCWGDKNNNEMAALRAKNGHEKPFNLKYIGIGNENWSDKYFKNFDIIYQKVMEYKEKYYKDHELHIISASGTAADDDNNRLAWNWLNQNHSTDPLLVDEHYYVGTDFSYYQTDRYDYFKRKADGGSDVFLGEYETRLNTANSMESAIADAAYLTGIERNSDVVKSVSFAPLFNKIGSTNWKTDLIWFDEYDSAGSITYYMQQMFANHYGTKLLNTSLEKDGERYSKNTGSPVIGTWQTKGYIDSVKVTRSDGKVLLDETFDDTSKTKDLWKAFPDGSGSFQIKDGKLYLDNNSSGLNAVWLPSVVNDAEWYDYKVEAVVVKESGNEGFLVGAGAKDKQNYYWYNIGGWANSRNVVERIRTGMSAKTILGNQHDWDTSTYVTKDGYTKTPSNEEMKVTFNYGVNGRLQAGYTTESSKVYENEYDMKLVPFQDDIYQVVSKDDQNVYIKLVNKDKSKKPIQLNIKNLTVAGNAKALTLSSDSLTTYNDVGNEQVKPVESEVTIKDDQISYTVPGYSINVITIPIKKSETKVPDVTPSPVPTKTPDTTASPVPTKSPEVTPSTVPTKAPEVTPSAAPSQKIAKVTKVKVKKRTNRTIQLTWTKVKGATGYEVYRYQTVKKKWTKVKTVKRASYTDQKLTPAVKYQYKIRAYIKDKTTVVRGAYSKVIKTVTLPNQVVVKQKKKSKKMILSWKKDKNVSGYQLYQKNKKGKYQRIKTIKKNTYTVKRGKNQQYRIRAYKTFQNKKYYGAYSKIIKVK